MSNEDQQIVAECLGNSLQISKGKENELKDGEVQEDDYRVEKDVGVGTTRSDDGNSRPSGSGQNSDRLDYEGMVAQRMRELLEKGPLKVTLAIAREVQTKVRTMFRLEGVGSKLKEDRRALWITALRFLALFIELEGEWTVAVAWDYWVRNEEYIEMIYILYNPGREYKMFEGTDIRYGGGQLSIQRPTEYLRDSSSTSGGIREREREFHS